LTKLNPSDFEGKGCISLGWATDEIWQPEKIEYVFKHALRTCAEDGAARSKQKAFEPSTGQDIGGGLLSAKYKDA